MTNGEYKLVEPTTMIKHTSYDLDLSFGFNLALSCTDRSISDISVYIMRCAKGCTACKTNAYTCLACDTNYVFNNVTKKCIPTTFCHSSCGACITQNNPSKCTSCSSSIS